MLQYLDSVTARGMSLVECLSFLFQLSFSQLGKVILYLILLFHLDHLHILNVNNLQDYSTDGMSNNLMNFLQHLREFGLLYQRKRTSGRFYPTRLALNIASGESKSSTESNKEG